MLFTEQLLREGWYTNIHNCSWPVIHFYSRVNWSNMALTNWPSVLTSSTMNLTPNLSKESTVFLTLRHHAPYGGCLIADRAIVVISVDTYLVLFAVGTCDPLSIIRSERVLECYPRDTVFVGKMALPEVAAHLSVKNCLDVFCPLSVTGRFQCNTCDFINCKLQNNRMLLSKNVSRC